MNADAILITTPAVDFTMLIGLSEQMLGYSPARAADASRRPLSDTERFLSCLAAFKDAKAPVGLSPYLLSHVLFSVLIAADERDLLDILGYCSGMSFVTTDTITRGVQAAIVSGTLGQWRDAVLSGCGPAVEGGVRALFNRIQMRFDGARLNVWSDCIRPPSNDKTFLLEGPR